MFEVLVKKVFIMLLLIFLFALGMFNIEPTLSVITFRELGN